MGVNVRHKILGTLAGLSLLYILADCEDGNKKWNPFTTKQVVVDVMVFNYLNRPIYDVYLNGEMVGGSASLSDSPYGQFSTATGIVVPLGPQTLTWRLDGPRGMARNGEVGRIKNSLTLNSKQIPPDASSLGVHIYPDNTAELIFSKDVLEQSERGLGYAREFQKHDQ